MVYPVDFERIKADTGFMNFMTSLASVRAAGIGFYESTISETEQVIASLDQEIEKLKE
jgi:hypothetical protein